MTDLAATLAAIDGVIVCQRCTGPLGDSPSPDFCSEDCQADWHAAHCRPLPPAPPVTERQIADAIRPLVDGDEARAELDAWVATLCWRATGRRRAARR